MYNYNPAQQPGNPRTGSQPAEINQPGAYGYDRQPQGLDPSMMGMAAQPQAVAGIAGAQPNPMAVPMAVQHPQAHQPHPQPHQQDQQQQQNQQHQNQQQQYYYAQGYQPQYYQTHAPIAGDPGVQTASATSSAGDDAQAAAAMASAAYAHMYPAYFQQPSHAAPAGYPFPAAAQYRNIGHAEYMMIMQQQAAHGIDAVTPHTVVPATSQPPVMTVTDPTGQTAPPGIRPKVTTTIWEDEKTLCYQVEARNICVARREDNDMINGTKLLNVACMTRGRRDGLLKAERNRHVVKTGAMHLKGVWIPYDRALDFANKEKIVDLLYPLFVSDIKSILYHPDDATGRDTQVVSMTVPYSGAPQKAVPPAVQHQQPVPSQRDQPPAPAPAGPAYSTASNTVSHDSSPRPGAMQLPNIVKKEPSQQYYGGATQLPQPPAPLAPQQVPPPSQQPEQPPQPAGQNQPVGDQTPRQGQPGREQSGQGYYYGQPTEEYQYQQNSYDELKQVSQ